MSDSWICDYRDKVCEYCEEVVIDFLNSVVVFLGVFGDPRPKAN